MMLLLGLGSNLEDRVYYLQCAINALADNIDIHTISSLYSSEALLPENAPQEWDTPFLNLVATAETPLPAEDILALIASIERSLGRKEVREHWSPREIDIDILACGDTVIQSEKLTIPHPGIENRAFFLRPLDEIAPTWQHPINNLNAHEMLRRKVFHPDAIRIEKRISIPPKMAQHDL